MTSNAQSGVSPGTVAGAFVALLIASGAFASCLLSGYEKGEGGSGGAGGATSSISVVSSSTTSSTSSAGGDELPICETTQYPEGPTGATPGGVRDAWFALRSIQLGDPDEPASVPGFDIDRVDSCNEECRGIDPECSRPDFLGDLTPAQEQERCDWPKAVDNSSVYLFESAALALGATDAQLSTEANEGTWSLLLRISAWNNTPDDSKVTLAIYSTIGFEPPADGTTGSSAATGAGGGGSPPAAPLWDGSDAWSVDSRSLEAPADNVDKPAFFTDNAYISDGTLVAELGGLFYAGSNRLPIKIATGRLVAPLNLQDNAHPTLQGAVFGGRWAVDDLIGAIGSLLVGPDTAFCTQPTLFNPVIERACRLVDVTTESGLGTCSALSFGIRFDAETITRGSIVMDQSIPPECPPVTCDGLLDGT